MGSKPIAQALSELCSPCPLMTKTVASVAMEPDQIRYKSSSMCVLLLRTLMQYFHCCSSHCRVAGAGFCMPVYAEALPLGR